MRVGELRPGMVLDQPVRDVNGRLLMGEGISLSERFIGVLMAWGIAEVTIRGERPPSLVDSEEGVPEDVAARAQDMVAARLKRNDLDHPFIQDVFRLAVARMTRLLAKGDITSLPASGTAPDHSDSIPSLDLEALVASNPALGAMPEVLARLAQAMENPSASPIEVADIILADPGLAARLLKVVNSALYGFPQRIETISRAVTIIGVQQLSALALGFTVMDMFKDIARDILDIRSFWRHCLACACGSRALASALGMPNTERYFVAGLLHDVGLLLFILRAPGAIRHVLEAVRGCGEGLVQAERRILGADHGMAGASLLTSWGLPASLVQSAGFHHDPLASDSPCEVAIIHTADFLAEALVFGSSGQTVMMPLDLAAFARLNAPSGVALTVFERVDDQLGQLEAIFMQNVPN